MILVESLNRLRLYFAYFKCIAVYDRGNKRRARREQGTNIESCILHDNLHSLSGEYGGSETLKRAVDLTGS